MSTGVECRPPSVDWCSPVTRINTDPRILSAAKIYDRHQSGLLKVYKTTRVGCTTSVGAEAINRREKTLMVVPTNKIASNTIVRDIPKYCDVKHPKITRIISNHNCVKIREMIAVYPDIAQLRMILLPEDDCRYCDSFDICEVTEFMRVESDVIVMTAQKLAIMVQKFMASTEFPSEDKLMIEEQIEILLSCRNIILDEVHLLQLMEMVNISVECHYVDESKPKEDRFRLEKYNLITKDKFSAIYEILERYKTIIADTEVQDAISSVVDETKSETYYMNHIKHVVFSPVDEVHLKRQSKIYHGVCSEIVEIAKNMSAYKLSSYDLDKLYDILTIATAEKIIVGGVRSDNLITVSLAAADVNSTEMLRSFIEMALEENEKRVILTSATIDDSVFDYDCLCSGMKAQNVLFGDNGDPLNTNDKMLLIADSKKYHRKGEYSVWNHKKEICGRIIEVLETYGDDECFIIAINRETAEMLKDELESLDHPHHVTYYKADDSIGVRCDARICISVGFAYKPSNSFDTLTNSLEESKRLLEVSMHMDTWQGISRVKDPEGKHPSAVICLGVRKQECENISSWGINRRTEIGEKVNGKKTEIDVTHNNDITKVKVIECKNWETMKIELKIHMTSTTKQQLEKIASENGVKPLGFISYRGFSAKSEAKISDREFVDKIMVECPRFEPLAEYLSAYGGKVETLTVLHGMSKTIFFEDVDDRSKLCAYLSQREMEYTLEEQNGKYHVRVYTGLIKAQTAKALAKKIMKEAKVKCDAYPKKISTNSKRGSEMPETIPLPFGADGTNIIHHEFFDKKDINGEYKQVDVRSFIAADKRRKEVAV